MELVASEISKHSSNEFMNDELLHEPLKKQYLNYTQKAPEGTCDL